MQFTLQEKERTLLFSLPLRFDALAISCLLLQSFLASLLTYTSPVVAFCIYTIR